MAESVVVWFDINFNEIIDGKEKLNQNQSKHSIMWYFHMCTYIDAQTMRLLYLYICDVCWLLAESVLNKQFSKPIKNIQSGDWEFVGKYNLQSIKDLKKKNI